MTFAWLPGARRIRATADGGVLKGGAPRAVWLALGAAPRVVSVHSAAQRLNQEGRPCHIVWDPGSGDVAQLIPAVRAGRALGAPERLEHVDGRRPCRDAVVNNEGRVCLQIGVLGRSGEPFTRGPMNGLTAILDWLDSWNIPRRWPAGRPMSRYPEATRSRVLWARGGHFAASQVPECDNRGPGDIDIERLTGTHLVGMPAVQVQHFEEVRAEELAVLSR